MDLKLQPVITLILQATYERMCSFLNAYGSLVPLGTQFIFLMPYILELIINSQGNSVSVETWKASFI